jgi:hypothetical protein
MGILLEAAMTFDAGRMKELDGMVRRMGAIASVFDVRSSTVGNRSFAAFRDLMDVYIGMCARELKEGRDFVEGGVKPNANDVELAAVAFERVFGKRPDQFTPSQ